MASPGRVDWMRLLQALFGTTLVAAGTAALNHYIERREDAVMRRTARRPLPLGCCSRRKRRFLAFCWSRGAAWLEWKTNALAACWR